VKAAVFGLSIRSTEFQREMACRLHFPFEILTDAEFKIHSFRQRE
jgi:peroxiredoxin